MAGCGISMPSTAEQENGLSSLALVAFAAVYRCLRARPCLVPLLRSTYKAVRPPQLFGRHAGESRRKSLAGAGFRSQDRGIWVERIVG